MKEVPIKTKDVLSIVFLVLLIAVIVTLIILWFNGLLSNFIIKEKPEYQTQEQIINYKQINIDAFLKNIIKERPEYQIQEQLMNKNQTNNEFFSCTDSDGGINFYETGVISSTNSTYNGYMDSCGGINNANPNPNELGEVFCNGDGSASRMTYECPQGCYSTICINVEIPTCLDSDKGIDPYNSGTINFNTQDGLVSKSDYCHINDVVEMSCDGIKPFEKKYPCPNGCSDGACN
jgi:hypothetical protein